MQLLNLPRYDAKITDNKGKKQIFDCLRRCYVALTPEEWVRQHFVNMLLTQKGYPATLTGNEIAITLNGMNRRCDTVVYDKQMKPRVIIEYKAPTVKIDAKVFAQIASYNMVLRVDYLIVSNGIQHFCCKMDYNKNGYTFLKEIPTFADIINEI